MNQQAAKKRFALGERYIAYEETGSGETLLLIHGFCGSSAYFHEISPLLSNNFHVVAPDLRGHGQSTPAPGSALQIDDLADDMSALLKHLRLSRVHVIGHSLGGYTALALAERHPEQLASLTLLHSTAHPDTEEGKANRLKGIASIRGSGIRVYVDGLIPKLFAPEHLSSMRGAVRLAADIGYKTDAETAALTMEAMRARPDRNHVLEQFGKPILLIAGQADQVFPPDRVFSAQGPGIRHALIEKAGHMSMLEQPDACYRILFDFLNSLRH